MRQDLKYPTYEAVVSVLTKIGIDPASRLNEHDQDIEYTTCSLDEFADYLALYSKADTSDYEKRVLGCYLLDCLNEHFECNGKPHDLQDQVFVLLYSDLEIHETEISYWSSLCEPKNTSPWAISSSLSQWIQQHT